MSPSSAGRGWSAVSGLGLAATLLGLETGCLAWMFGGGRVAPLLLHAATCLAANLLAWRGVAAPSPASATLRMTAMLMPFLGPVAPFAAFALLVWQLLRPDTQPDAATWHEHLFPNLAADPLNDRMDAITRRRPPSATDEDVESFYDVLRWGTLPEREHVLSLISRSFRAEFAPVLREGLASGDLGLRAQAAAGLSLLETRISARLATLEQSLRETTSAEARERTAVALAQALAEAAHSGLYDELRTIDMRREIVSLLTPLLDTNAGDAALGVMLGRTMIHLGELDQAVATLERSLESKVGGSSDAALGWLIEGLFRRSDFARLTAVLGRRREQAASLVAGDGPLAPALSFWSAAP